MSDLSDRARADVLGGEDVGEGKSLVESVVGQANAFAGLLSGLGNEDVCRVRGSCPVRPGAPPPRGWGTTHPTGLRNGRVTCGVAV